MSLTQKLASAAEEQGRTSGGASAAGASRGRDEGEGEGEGEEGAEGADGTASESSGNESLGGVASVARSEARSDTVRSWAGHTRRRGSERRVPNMSAFGAGGGGGGGMGPVARMGRRGTTTDIPNLQGMGLGGAGGGDDETVNSKQSLEAMYKRVYGKKG